MEIDREAVLVDAEARLKQWDATIAGLHESIVAPNTPLSLRVASLVHKRDTLANKIETLRQGRRPLAACAREIVNAAREVEVAWACVVSAMSRETTASTRRQWSIPQ